MQALRTPINVCKTTTNIKKKTIKITKRKKVKNSNDSTKESEEVEQEKDESLRIAGGISAKTIVVGSLMDSIPEALFVGILVALNHQGITGAVSGLLVIWPLQ
jgi:hypothetical protein